MAKEIIIRDNPAPPLTAAEAKQFERLQKVVQEDMRAFMRVGNALKEIHDRKLYREDWRTFEAYCREVFELGRSTAYQYIGAFEVVENVRNCGHFDNEEGVTIDLVPNNEAQCRPLVGLQPNQQREIWRAVVENVEPGRKVTGSLVKKVTKKFIGETTKAKVRNTREAVPADRKISGPLKEAFDALLAEVEVEVAAGFKATSREVIVGHLDQLRHTIAEAGNLIEDTAFQGGDDASKLSKAGYKLFRMDKPKMVIKERAGGGWPIYKGPGLGEIGKAMPFHTIKEMEAAFVELMKNPMHLRG